MTKAKANTLADAVRAALDDFEHDHEEERNTAHHGDAPRRGAWDGCSYCRHFKSLRAALLDAEGEA